MNYIYCFSIQPTPDLRFSRSLKQLLKLLDTKFAVIRTEDEFTEFRHELLRCHLELKEIERLPYYNPESVI